MPTLMRSYLMLVSLTLALGACKTDEEKAAADVAAALAKVQAQRTELREGQGAVARQAGALADGQEALAVARTSYLGELDARLAKLDARIAFADATKVDRARVRALREELGVKAQKVRTTTDADWEAAKLDLDRTWALLDTSLTEP